MGGTVRYNKEFYGHEVVAEAIQAWGEIGTFALDDDEEGYLVVALDSLAEGEPTDEVVAQVLGEFQNFVLGMEAGRRR